ncbi:MAG: hypothetical protein WD906_04925 [Anaerolineales bacterium]
MRRSGPEYRTAQRTNAWLRVLTGIGLWVGAACTRASVQAPFGNPAPAPAVAGEIPDINPDDRTTSYAVVWAASEAGLAVHQPAGISSPIVEHLRYDARDISLTGGASRLGTSLWVEIHRPSGGAGWVPSWNLTEDVSVERFCADPRAEATRGHVVTALVDQDGPGLSSLVSPKRGLFVRVGSWNSETVIGPSSVSGIFGAAPSVWGHHRGDAVPLTGTFQNVVLTDFEDVRAEAVQEACGTIPTGESGPSADWPPEYAGLNLYTFYLPSSSIETRFGWKSWVVAFEYLRGQPYVAGILRYDGEIPP